jgi:hypothetical protein
LKLKLDATARGKADDGPNGKRFDKANLQWILLQGLGFVRSTVALREASACVLLIDGREGLGNLTSGAVST